MGLVSAILSATRTLRIIIVEDVDTPAPASAQSHLGSLGRRVRVLRLAMDDCWVRDTGPVMLTGGEGATFRFNAWGGANGGCYLSYARDALVGARVCGALGLRARAAADMVLEGGSVSCDGEGTVVTTEECLLNGNRNGGWARARVEARLRATLGARKVVWIAAGAACDADTSGHVDNMAVFVGPAHVMLTWAPAHVDPEQHRRSTLAWCALARARDARGRPLRVSRVTAPSPVVRSAEEAAGVRPAPDAKRRPQGERVCASYVNVVMAGDVVFAPAFGVPPEDDRARRELQGVFAEYRREVVMVQARELVLAGGGLHCLCLGVPRRDGEETVGEVGEVGREMGGDVQWSWVPVQHDG